MDDTTEVLATVSASGGRRWLGVIALYGLAALLIYVALAQPPAVEWLVFLIVLGAACLWLADKMRRSSTRVIELTRAGLRDSSGDVIADLANIQSVDRGFFAFKPSNGFLVRTKTAEGGRVWHPGIWWRLGRQIGVGGVTAASQTKFMTEILVALIAERDGDFKL